MWEKQKVRPGGCSSRVCASSEGDLNARPIGLQPIALPLSYQNYFEGFSMKTRRVDVNITDQRADAGNADNTSRTTPEYEIDG
jgi:hypothetical protein